MIVLGQAIAVGVLGAGMVVVGAEAGRLLRDLWRWWRRGGGDA